MSLPQETSHKIKELLFEKFKEDNWDFVEAWHRRQTGNSITSSSKYDTTSAEHKVVANLVKAEFESKHKYLKRVPGGYSAFQGSQHPAKDESNCWDPGVAHEVSHYGSNFDAQDDRYTNMPGMVSLQQQDLCTCCQMSESAMDPLLVCSAQAA
jgi:hypothetical protein